jgi:hypothetical protein
MKKIKDILKEHDKRLLEDNTPWWLEGLVFGIVLFITNVLIILPLTTEQGITLKTCLIGIPLCLCVGLLYGIVNREMKKYYRSKNKKKHI